MSKPIAITETAQKIIDWANNAPLARSIDMDKFREKIKSPEAESFLKEACVFCDVEPVYA